MLVSLTSSYVKNKKKCKTINFYFTKKLVDICKSLKIKIIYISSDHLFDGKSSFKDEEQLQNH